MTGAADRRSRVETVMGLPVSVLLRGRGVRDAAVDAAVDALYADLRQVDAVFSTYRADSEVSLLRAGVLPVELASPQVRHVLDLCEQAREETDGWFDAWRPDATGVRRLDPSGLVKGWAVERASGVLDRFDHLDWLVNAGGDVVGRAVHGEPWRVGVEDPRDRSRLLVVVPLTCGAVATSGTAARGAHLDDPRTGRPVDPQLLSATVVGPSLTTADVLATATFVQGPEGLARVAARPGYEAVVVLPDGRLVGTPGATRQLASA